MSPDRDHHFRLIYPDSPDGMVVPDYTEVLPPEDFIRALHEDTIGFLKARGAVLRRSFSGTNMPIIPAWDRVSIKHGGIADLSLELEEATIFEDNHFTYAVVMGTRHTQQAIDKPGLSLQVGYGIWDNKPFNTRCLKELTNRRTNNRDSVSFRIIDKPLVTVSGWANAIRNGGEEIRDSYESPLRAHEGYESSMDLIRRTLSPGPIEYLTQSSGT